MSTKSVRQVGDATMPAAEMINGVLAMLHSVSGEIDVERELAAIIAWLPGIVARLDMNYRYVFVSPQIESISGRPPSFYIGKSHTDLETDHVLQARWKAIFDLTIRTKSVQELEHPWVDLKETSKFFVTRVVPLINFDSRVVGLITISSDHSERERRAQTLYDEGIGLRRADDKKNEYLATLAHELRGPLAPISSAVQLMKLSNNPETIRKARDIIERQVSQMSGLIDDLMEVGRINSGKMLVSLAPVAVEELTRNVMESTQPVFSAKQQPLKVIEIPPNLWVSGDTVRLIQLLTNLLTNASKYSPIKSEVILEVIKVANTVEFRVSDSGIGLTKSSINEIFDMFAQVHASGRDARGGLGIGLALARKIANLHDGKITVDSPGLNKGSTFVFAMPLIDKPEISGVANPPILIADQVLRLLVVDDNLDGANTLADMLKEMGHTVTKAYNGTSAIVLLENEPFDLAFLDLGLPDKTGIEVALTVLKKDTGKHVRLIALTGLSRERDRFVTQAAGFEEHLIKPAKFEDLVRLVGNLKLLAKQ
jgi:signal transduction histidine kinase